MKSSEMKCKRIYYLAEEGGVEGAVGWVEVQ
jgi:hypothetical protein